MGSEVVSVWVTRMSQRVEPPSLEMLVDCEVRRLSFDFQVRLRLVDGPYREKRVNAELVIEAPVQFRGGDGLLHEIQPNDMATVAPILELSIYRILRASFDAQHLTIDFEDSRQIAVTTPQVESWNLTGTGVPEVIAGRWYLSGPADGPI